MRTRRSVDSQPRRSLSRGSNHQRSQKSTHRRREVRRAPNQTLINELQFKNKEEIDEFNTVRRGYVSPMKGFEEDFFVSLLKTQFQLEKELEQLKGKLIIKCTDFNPIIGFKLFDPPKERAPNSASRTS